ncbi:MAG: hypothetical protein RLZZ56_785 [Actinomycetota bacterium]|jgi:uncharacterized protein YggU (UPF0235/DUF167 family)
MRITVTVKPGSKKGPLVEEVDGNYLVFVPERAVDGKANDALIKILADHLKLKPKNLTLESGFTSKIKRIRIEH